MCPRTYRLSPQKCQSLALRREHCSQGEMVIGKKRKENVVLLQPNKKYRKIVIVKKNCVFYTASPSLCLRGNGLQ